MGRVENVLYKTAKVQVLSVTEDQLLTLMKMADLCRSLWNKALEERMKAYEAYKKEKDAGIEKPDTPKVSFMSQCKDLLAPLRQSDPEYAAILSNTSRSVLDKLQGSFQSFFALVRKGDHLARPPRFRSKDYFFTVGWWINGIKLKGNVLSLAHSLPEMAVLDFNLPDYVVSELEGKEIQKVEIYRNPSRLDDEGHFGVSIIYRMPKPTPCEIKRVVALSLGSKEIGIVDSRGRAWVIPVRRPDKHWQPLIESVDKRRGKPGGKRSRSKRRRDLARKTMFAKWRAQDLDWQHKFTKWLMSKGDCFVISKEQIRLGLSQTDNVSTDVHRGVQNTGLLARLLQLIKYKAAEQGKQVLEVDATSISVICWNCGAKHSDLSVKSENFTDQMNCECGQKLSRKINGALNVMRRGLCALENDTWPEERKEAAQTILLTADEPRRPRPSMKASKNWYRSN